MKVTLSSSNLSRTTDYWKKLLNLTVLEEKEKSVTLGYGPNQVEIEFVDIGKFYFNYVQRKWTAL